MEAAAKAFFASPRFAVVGASQDANKFGYRSALDFWSLRKILTVASSGLVPCPWAARDAHQSASTRDQIPVQDIPNRGISFGFALAVSNVALVFDSSRCHKEGLERSQRCWRQRCLATARQLRLGRSRVREGEFQDGSRRNRWKESRRVVCPGPWRASACTERPHLDEAEIMNSVTVSQDLSQGCERRAFRVRGLWDPQLSPHQPRPRSWGCTRSSINMTNAGIHE